MQREIVDLAGLAQMVADEEEAGEIEIRGEGTATVDSTLVARLLRNLLRNSAQHAPSASRWVHVDDHTLLVGDDGPGIATERQGVVLQAFRRGQGSSGHGLGLAIVAQIVQMHGAELTLSEPPGLEVRVDFPG